MTTILFAICHHQVTVVGSSSKIFIFIATVLGLTLISCVYVCVLFKLLQSCVLAEQSQCMGSAGQMWVSFLLQNKTFDSCVLFWKDFAVATHSLPSSVCMCCVRIISRLFSESCWLTAVINSRKCFVGHITILGGESSNSCCKLFTYYTFFLFSLPDVRRFYAIFLSLSLAVFLVCLCQSKKAIHQQVLFGTVECKEVRGKKQDRSHR